MMHADVENYILDLSRALHIEDTHGVFGNELELIALIRNCPFLYDKNRIDFKDTEKKEVTWQAIATVMHDSVSDCQARWKSLREQYGKIKRAIALNDPEQEKLMQWEYLEDMKFLDKHIKPRRCIKRNHNNFFFGTEQPEHIMIDNLNEESYNIEWLDEPKFSDNKELNLINLVRLCPFLYDKHHADAKDTNKKEGTWISIGKQLGSSALDCQTRWKTLRERYGRERKMYQADPNHKVWEYYDHMSFLDKHVRCRRSLRTTFRPILPKIEHCEMLSSTTSGVVLDPALSEDLNAHYPVQKLEFVDSTNLKGAVEMEGTEHALCLSPSSVTDSHQTISNMRNSSVLSNVTSSTAGINVVPDEDVLFGQFMAAELARIHSRRKKMRLKSDILKLMYETMSEESN